ncbi:hypothetical protein FB451DRAFT_1255061 [Mycena latifolia]|nr:hypothetical protein FB451DRAFT_1255061 [Mycena latifolia]
MGHRAPLLCIGVCRIGSEPAGVASPAMARGAGGGGHGVLADHSNAGHPLWRVTLPQPLCEPGKACGPAGLSPPSASAPLLKTIHTVQWVPEIRLEQRQLRRLSFHIKNKVPRRSKRRSLYKSEAQYRRQSKLVVIETTRVKGFPSCSPVASSKWKPAHSLLKDTREFFPGNGFSGMVLAVRTALSKNHCVPGPRRERLWPYAEVCRE